MTEQLIDKTHVIISFYDQRSADDLRTLISSMQRFASGAEFDITVVVNSTSDFRLEEVIDTGSVSVVYRENIGMNIGAWSHGWSLYPNYRDYLFLQDECEVIQENWLTAFRRCCEQPGVGMVGEILNEKWSKPWDRLREERGRMRLPEHKIDGVDVNRVDFYLHFMASLNIDPGESGRHLQSLVWYFPNQVMQKLKGFPIGNNYGECIGSEIAVSRQVAALGYRVVQLAEEPFSVIRHKDWKQSAQGGAWQHQSSVATNQSGTKRSKTLARQPLRKIRSFIKGIFNP